MKNCHGRDTDGFLFRRMYFAGDHMTYLIGWMNGALESGRSAATAIHARAPQEVKTTA